MKLKINILGLYQAIIFISVDKSVIFKLIYLYINKNTVKNEKLLIDYFY